MWRILDDVIVFAFRSHLCPSSSWGNKVWTPWWWSDSLRWTALSSAFLIGSWCWWWRHMTPTGRTCTCSRLTEVKDSFMSTDEQIKVFISTFSSVNSDASPIACWRTQITSCRSQMTCLDLDIFHLPRLGSMKYIFIERQVVRMSVAACGATRSADQNNNKKWRQRFDTDEWISSLCSGKLVTFFTFFWTSPDDFIKKMIGCSWFILCLMAPPGLRPCIKCVSQWACVWGSYGCPSSSCRGSCSGACRCDLGRWPLSDPLHSRPLQGRTSRTESLQGSTRRSSWGYRAYDLVEQTVHTSNHLGQPRLYKNFHTIQHTGTHGCSTSS